MFESLNLLSALVFPCLGIALLVAIYTDIKSRLIPNWLVLIVLGLGFVRLGLDLENVLAYGQSFLIGVIVWGGLFYGRMIGGGDAKLMMALSLFVLPLELLSLYLCVTIAGGLQAGLWSVLKKGNDLPYAVAIGVGTAVYGLINFTAV